MKTLFFLVRHGSTTDSGKGIFRGQRNSALDKEGFLDAHELKEFLSKRKWHHIFCSDLTRAIQTATIISEDHPDESPNIVKALRPWDIGYLTGKDKKEYADEMKAFVDHPERIPDDGESDANFEERVHPLFGEAMQIGLTDEMPVIIVGHSSLVHSLSHLLYGPDHKEIAVKPGGVIEVTEDKGEFEAKAVFKAGHDDSSFAPTHSS